MRHYGRPGGQRGVSRVLEGTQVWLRKEEHGSAVLSIRIGGRDILQGGDSAECFERVRGPVILALFPRHKSS